MQQNAQIHRFMATLQRQNSWRKYLITSAPINLRARPVQKLNIPMKNAIICMSRIFRFQPLVLFAVKKIGNFMNF